MKLDFEKTGGLIPVIIQDAANLKVLMTAYMNEEAFQKTQLENRVTFYSRSKQRLWTKGETSGNFLNVVEMAVDCDSDALLIKVNPDGPTCHTGSESCFGDTTSAKGFLYKLGQIIESRALEGNPESYTVQLLQKGINKVAQKVGEEAIELVIEAKDNDDDLFKNEAADLLYHLLILFKAKNISLEEVEQVLKARMK